MLNKVKTWAADRPIEQVFLWVAIPLVSLFIVAIPMLQGWDEATHFMRVYQISEGDVLPERFGERNAGDKTPVDIIQMSDAAVGDLIRAAQSGLVEKTDVRFYYKYLIDTEPSEHRIDKYFEASAIYSPMSYIPQSAGVFVARSLNLPLLSYVYMGRILNAALFIALVYFAIMWIPRGKWVIFAVAMLPTSLTAAATLSPDAIINASALLLVALFIMGLLAKVPLTRRQLLLVLALVSVLALAKQTYFVFAFLFVFLPPTKAFGSLKRYLLWNATFIFIALALSLGWYMLVDDIAHNIHFAQSPGKNIDSEAQMHHVLSNPITYAGLLLWEWIGRINPIYYQLAGDLTWKGIKIPQPIIFFVYLGLFMAYYLTRLEAGIRPQLTRLQRRLVVWGPVLVGISIAALVYTSLYLAFTEVGSTKILGVQGRYFIPLIALLLPVIILFDQRKAIIKKIDYDAASALLLSILVLQNVAAFVVIFTTNYVPGIRFV